MYSRVISTGFFWLTSVEIPFWDFGFLRGTPIQLQITMPKANYVAKRRAVAAYTYTKTPYSRRTDAEGKVLNSMLEALAGHGVIAHRLDDAERTLRHVMAQTEAGLRSYGKHQLFLFCAGRDKPLYTLPQDMEKLVGRLFWGQPRGTVPRRPTTLLDALRVVTAATAEEFGNTETQETDGMCTEIYQHSRVASRNEKLSMQKPLWEWLQIVADRLAEDAGYGGVKSEDEADDGSEAE